MQKDAAGSGRRVSVSDPGNGSHAGSYPHAAVDPTEAERRRLHGILKREKFANDI